MSGPDFPYPSHWDAATLACRDWRLSLRLHGNQGMLGYIASSTGHAFLPKGNLKDEILSLRLPTFGMIHRQQ